MTSWSSLASNVVLILKEMCLCCLACFDIVHFQPSEEIRRTKDQPITTNIRPFLGESRGHSSVAEGGHVDDVKNRNLGIRSCDYNNSWNCSKDP